MKARALQVEWGKTKYDFTLGEIVESLQGAGVNTSAAIRIARAVEKHFQNRGEKTIRLENLVDELAAQLESELGKDAAERFRKQTPPFVPLSVQVNGKVKPFSQKVIVAPLEKLGLKLKEALAVAEQVEQSLRSKGYELVSERELVHLTAAELEASQGRELRNAYEVQLKQPSDIQVVEASGKSFPFSQGILAQSLMAIGLAPEVAHGLARQLDDDLWHKGLSSISRNDLYEEVRRILQMEVGKGFARRYELMRAVRRSNRPLVILIGGAPGTGKSTLAYELAYRLGIRRIVSSDAIRQALRSLISPQLSPGLHRSSFEAWQEDLLPGESPDKPRPKRVIRGFQGQAQQLSLALTGIIQRCIDEGVSVIIEGVHLVPGALPLASFEGATLLELVLAVESKSTHQRHFALRDEQTEQRRKQSSYVKHFPEIRMIHDFICQRAEALKTSIIKVNQMEQATDRALELVLNAALRYNEQKGKKGKTAAVSKR